MFTIDAHLDLAMNALEWNRDLRRPTSELNAREVARGLTDKPDRGLATVSLPDLRRGGIGLVVATQIARYTAPDNPLPGWNSAEQAWAQTQGQLAWYREMEASGEMVQIRDLVGLEAHVARWEAAVAAGEDLANVPVGYILTLEGADSLVTLAHLERAHADGLRALGPAHYGPGRYAYGTDASAPLEDAGRELLKAMDRLGMILDTTHLCDLAFWEALEIFTGPVWASHCNCRVLVDHNRQMSDDMLRAVIERGGVIGMPLDAWMMVPGWVRGKTEPKAAGCDLSVMLDHLDHVCQVAGNADHVGIGSDLDGGYGREQSPYDLETIADLSRLPQMLTDRGYSSTDIEKIMRGNWLACLRRAWAT